MPENQNSEELETPNSTDSPIREANAESHPVASEGQPLGAEDYEHLLDDYSHFVPPAENELLHGRVLTVTAKDVIVDFSYKSEGIVPLEQFRNASGEITVKKGDTID